MRSASGNSAGAQKRGGCLVAALWLGATTCYAGDLRDDHLNVIPRSAADAARVHRLTAPTGDFSVAETSEHLPAGAATVSVPANADAFSQPSANLGFEQFLDFRAGNALFRRLWVSAPSSTPASDGLGPLYNARSCLQCHPKDGRGHPPEDARDDAVAMLLRLSIPGGAAIGAIKDYVATAPDPTYGTQLQEFASAGHKAEYRLQIDYSEREVRLGDGEVAHLATPTYSIADPGYGPLHKDVMISPRVAPQMIGLGLLEAIPAADILAWADRDDADGDGVSGRANIVWSPEYDRPMLGRFGLKAGMATIRQQSGAALSGDMGISNEMFPDPWGECTSVQKHCRDAPHGDTDGAGAGYEIDGDGLALVAFYARNLAVPARRATGDPKVLHGKRVFYQTGCTACHRPKFVTHRLRGRDEHSFQLIWPYTDLLLHDMGDGLADNRPEARASGREWRTPPLWGIGLTAIVSGHTRFLHDGRARNLTEAILWHGGEAEAARNRFISMSKQDRDALIRFLESL